MNQRVVGDHEVKEITRYRRKKAHDVTCLEADFAAVVNCRANEMNATGRVRSLRCVIDINVSSIATSLDES